MVQGASHHGGLHPAIAWGLRLLCGLALAGIPAAGHAAEPTATDGIETLYAEAERAKELQDYGKAAGLYADALSRLPENNANSATRLVLLSSALDAYLKAYRQAPDDGTRYAHLEAAQRAASRFKTKATEAYGVGWSLPADAQADMAEVEQRLDEMRARGSQSPAASAAPAAGSPPAEAQPQAQAHPASDSGAAASASPLTRTGRVLTLVGVVALVPTVVGATFAFTRSTRREESIDKAETDGFEHIVIEDLETSLWREHTWEMVAFTGAITAAALTTTGIVLEAVGGRRDASIAVAPMPHRRGAGVQVQVAF